MIKYLNKIIGSALLITVLNAVPFAASAQAVHAIDSVGMEKTIRFERGARSATFNGRVRAGTAHWYKIRAKAGQQMQVVLKTGNKTSFTIFGQQAGILDNADGVKYAAVELPHSGEYLIEIGTDATANYTLEVAIK